MNKNNNKTNETISYNGLYVFFLGILVLFTTINLYEFIIGIGGRQEGLTKISLMENQSVTVWGGIQRLLGKKQVYGATTYGDVARLGNGYSYMPEIDKDVSPMLNSVEAASELADSVGARFLYVQCPVKQLDRRYYNSGVMDYSLDKYNAMIAGLSDMGVDYIDMKQVLEESDSDWFDYFYYSDHHWRNSAAFIAYNEICNKLIEQGYYIDEALLEEGSYKIEEYKDIFLGSHGRMAGPLYTGVDGYELYIPLDNMEYSINIPSRNISISGSFEDCIVHREYLKEYSYDYYAYYTYFDEDCELIEVVNHSKPDGPKVVIVRDSLAVPVSAFLINQCSELDILDLRYLENMDSIEYIRNKKPDYIIYIFGTGYLGDEGASLLRSFD